MTKPTNDAGITIDDGTRRPRLCSICGGPIAVQPGGWAEGHNASPVNSGRCCDDCNSSVVLPARMRQFARRR